jgi:hypothetical protein
LPIVSGALACPWRCGLQDRLGQRFSSEVGDLLVFGIDDHAAEGFPVGVLHQQHGVPGLTALGIHPGVGRGTIWAVARLTVNANGITVRQMLTPDGLQGRVNTTGRMLAWGGTPFGALIGGLAADTYGVRVAYLILAVPIVISLALVIASPVRGLRIAVD